MKTIYITLSGILLGFLFSQNIVAQNWMEINKICATERWKGANFGYSVDIYGDYAIVGAPYDFNFNDKDEYVDSVGAAYIYKYDGEDWQVQQKLCLEDGDMYDGFGASVALHEDYAIIGSPGRNIAVYDTSQGEAFIYKRNNDVWELQQNLIAPDGLKFDLFGSSVAINDNFIVVAAMQASGIRGKVYIYEKQETTWNLTQILNPTTSNSFRYFGNSVSIHNDYLAIGCRSAFDANEEEEMPGAGAVYIYKYNSQTWEQSQKIVAEDRHEANFFGYSVDIYGNHLIVGAPNDNRNEFGEIYPETADLGSAYIFKLEDETWTQVKKLHEPDSPLFNWYNQFGSDVSIYENTIAVATHQQGWDAEGQNFAAHSGGFYMYRNAYDEWIYTQKIVASDRDTADHFAYSVSIYENKIIAGALHQDHDENNLNDLKSAGAAYIFENFAEIIVSQDALFVENGGVYDFGEIAVGNSSDFVDFYISNIGAATLYLTENPLIQFGENGDDESFIVFQENTENYVMPNDNTHFSLRFEPSFYGELSAQIVINTNDINNNPYIINVVGIGRKHEQLITDFADFEIKTYGDADFLISANASSDLDVVFTSSDPNIAACTGENGNIISIINAGECEIYANQEGNYAYFSAPQVSKTLIVNQKEIDVFAEEKNKYFGDEDPDLTYEYSPELVGDDNFEGELIRSSGENVGVYSINQGTLNLSDNYILNYNSEDFKILKRKISVIADANQTKVYTGSDPTPFTYTYSGGLIGNDNFTGFLSREPGEDIGEYQILQNNLALSNNYEINFVSDIFTITPKEIIITADPNQSKAFGMPDPASFTYSLSEYLYSGNYISGSLERIAGEEVGQYEITVGSLEISPNYTFVYQSDYFEILPKSISLKADPNQSKFYGDPDPVLTYFVYGNLEPGDSFTGALSREPGEALGNYPITLGSLSAGDNYFIDFISQDFEIKKKNVLVTVNPNQSKEYGDSDPIFTFNYTPELASGDSFYGELSRESGELIGLYAILPGNLSLNSNYELTIMPGAEFEITKREIAITLDPNQGKIYGETDPELTFSYTGSLVSGDAFDGFLYRQAGENVGEYQIFYDNFQINPNYNLSFFGTENYFEIFPREFTVYAIETSKTYGHSDPYEFDYITEGSLAFNDYLTGQLQRESGENAGTYEILQGSLNILPNSNYDINYISANFEILPRNITIKANENQSKIYGEPNPSIYTYSITSGNVINDDVLSGQLTRESGEDAGFYEILQGNLSLGPNYNINYIYANFEILKAMTEIYWENPEDIYTNQALSEVQLNASSDIEGDFVYTPNFGTYMPQGNNQELHVLFTPNSQNYNQAEKTVYINVLLWTNLLENFYSELSVYPNPTSGMIY
ncbi:MAG: hypothetical protein GX793_06580, partial [Bacteroidales bacterium]|nr:hypothetical protein [Bacteroidales bacterium]